MLYANGRIPAPGTPGSPLFVVASGTDSNGYWEFQFTAMTWRKWLAAKAYAEKHYGRTIHIRTGWNVYRPYPVQQAARIRACNDGNCNGASVAGYSPHGGNWGGRDCLAIDVDPNGLTWAQVWQACKAAGFAVGLITERISGIKGGEPWHITDFDAFAPVPAGGGARPFPIPKIDPQEAEMTLYIRTDTKGDYAVTPGVVIRQKGTDVFNVLQAANPDAFKIVTIFDRNLEAVLKGIGGMSAADIAALQPGGMWVSGQLTSNPTLDYGSSRPTQEVVLKSMDTKLDAVLKNQADVG
jgi:hypothetical protein